MCKNAKTKNNMLSHVICGCFFPLFFWEPFPNVIFDFPEVSALCISPKYGRYTGDFPQMPVNTGAPLFIRATWPHWEGGVGANSPLWPRYHPIWFKTSTLKENCLSNYCWGKKRRKKTNISPFPATHTYIKLTFVSFFSIFLFWTFP